MVGRPPQFKLRDVTRAIRAAQAAGISTSTVHVRCPNGSVITIGGDKPEAAAAVKPGKVRQPVSSRSSRLAK